MPPKKENDRTIQVFLRVRPLSKDNEVGHTTKNITYDPTDPCAISVQREGYGVKGFHFHRVFQPGSSQEEVYNEFASQAVNAALEGYHGVMFVYGQTGSGKTHTISGPKNAAPEDLGVLQRSLRTVWDRIKSDTSHEYDCSVSYLQMYNEILSDLLDDNHTNNTVKLVGVPDRHSDMSLIHERTGKNIDRPVMNYEETINYFDQGKGNVIQAETKMNKQSSRSHTMLTLIIKKRPKNGTEGGKACEGRLILCDLAGSERIKKTGATGERLDEAAQINGSLLVLGRVVQALTERKSQHVPFRESKLTRILQYSLSGWGKTSLVINVSPSDYNTDETLSSIQFGQRAIQIKQNAQKHQTVDYKALYTELQSQFDSQRDAAISAAIAEERSEHEEKVKILNDRLDLLYSEAELLKRENKSLKEENEALRRGEKPPPRTPGGPSTTPARGTASCATGMSPIPSGPGGANSSSSASGSSSQDPPHVLGYSYMEILEKMKERLEERDAKIVALSEEKHAIGDKVNETESKLFTVAKRFQMEKMQNTERTRELRETIQELQHDLATAKGTDYLSTNTVIDDDTNVAAAAAEMVAKAEEAAREVVSGQRSASESRIGCSVDEEELSKSYEAIKQLSADRTTLAAYKSQARKAIQLLAKDRAELQQQIDALVKK